MGDYLSVATDAGEQALDLTKRAQDAAVSAVATVSEVASSFVPDLKGQLPFQDSIPAPKDVVSAYFDLAGKFFEAGRDYALALFDATSPVTDKVMPTPKRRTTAKKSGAKRAA
jgi:hypothetical protein